MEKKAAIDLIEKTFNSGFDLEQYTLFLRNLLNDYDDDKENDWSQGNYIYESFRDHISRFKRLGIYTDPEGSEMELLVIETKGASKLERARTSLRNFVIKRLNDRNRDFALAAFYSKEDNGADWRFSFIKIEHESYKDTKGKVKTRKELTPAKRYSFLVGEDEHAYTAQKQLLPVLQNDYSNPAMEDLEACFSIEKVTDEFFEQYKDLYIKLSEHFEADKAVQTILITTDIDTARFTKKLLGQIVFLYFLQKKGWMGVPKDGAWGNGQKRFVQNLFSDAVDKNKNFFNDYLKYLFYEALAKPRTGVDPSYYKRFDCKIPFLNGGLFEADYDWQSANFTIPNILFKNEEKNKAGDKGTGVLDVFDRYNFTIKEDEPLEKEVAVDPEMLGKVFENMLEITERKSKGAFYTPREIVHYMCQESLIHYLDNAINDSVGSYQPIDSDQLALFSGFADKKGQRKIELQHNGKILVPKEHIEEFVRKGFLAIENDQIIIEKGKETSTYKFQLPEPIRKNADLLDEKLTDIKICDPAIGSGAFPVGLMHELVTAQKVLLPYLTDEYLGKKLGKIDLGKAEHKKDPIKYSYRIKRHAIQESIYGVDIDASAIDIARLRLWLSLVVDEEDFYSIETLPNLDYKIVRGNSLIGFPEEWKSPAFDKIEKLKNKFFDETDLLKKKQYKSEIDKEIIDRLSDSKKIFGYDIDFDFKLFFSEVWHYNNGFDIIIGNPPYDVYDGKKADEIPTIKKIKIYEKAKSGKLNAYKLFLAKSTTLLRQNGVFCQIFQNSFLGDNSAKLIRHHFLTDQTILKIDSFPERDNLYKRVFRSAKMSVCILFATNLKKDNYDFVLRIWEDRWMLNSKSVTFSNREVLEYDKESFVIPSISSEEKPTLDILSSYLRFKEIITCFQGEINLSTNADIITEIPSASTKPLLKGAGVQKWYLPNKMSQGKIEYLEYKKYLHKNRGAKSKHYLYPRIVMQGITGVDEKFRIKATIIDEDIFCGHSINYITLSKINKKAALFYLAILNSEVSNWFFKRFSTNSNVNSYEVHNLPSFAYEDRYESISIISSYLLDKKLLLSPIVFSFFEVLSSSLIYELFFSKEIKQSQKELLKYLSDLTQIDEKMSSEKKLSIVQSEFNRLYDPNHPVRNNLETLDSVEEVRIIKEALK